MLYRLKPNTYVSFSGEVRGRILSYHGTTVEFAVTEDSPPIYTNKYADTIEVGRSFFVLQADLEPLP